MHSFVDACLAGSDNKGRAAVMQLLQYLNGVREAEGQNAASANCLMLLVRLHVRPVVD